MTELFKSSFYVTVSSAGLVGQLFVLAEPNSRLNEQIIICCCLLLITIKRCLLNFCVCLQPCIYDRGVVTTDRAQSRTFLILSTIAIFFLLPDKKNKWILDTKTITRSKPWVSWSIAPWIVMTKTIIDTLNINPHNHDQSVVKLLLSAVTTTVDRRCTLF